MYVERLEARALLSVNPLQFTMPTEHTEPDIVEAAVEEPRGLSSVNESAHDPGQSASSARTGWSIDCCTSFTVSRAFVIGGQGVLPIGYAVTLHRPLHHVAATSALASHGASQRVTIVDHIMQDLAQQWSNGYDDAGPATDLPVSQPRKSLGSTGISLAFASNAGRGASSESPLLGAEGEPEDMPTVVEQTPSDDASDVGFLSLSAWSDTSSLRQYDSQTGMDITLSAMPGNLVERAPTAGNEGAAAANASGDNYAIATPSAGQLNFLAPNTDTTNEVPALPQHPTPDSAEPMLQEPSLDANVAGGETTRLFDGDLSRYLDAHSHEFWRLELDRLGVPNEFVPPPEFSEDPVDLESVPEVAEGSVDVVPAVAELGDGGAVELLPFDRLAAVTQGGVIESAVDSHVAPVSIDARLGIFRSIELASHDDSIVHQSASTATTTWSTTAVPAGDPQQADDRAVATTWQFANWPRWISAAVVTGLVWASVSQVEQVRQVVRAGR